jgi:uncharacterized protein (TIRG00374 family)
VLRKSRWVGLLLTIVFLGLTLSKVDPGQLAGTLREANYVLVLPAAVATLTGYLLRTARWRTILAGAMPASFGPLFSILMIGFATNNVLPARLGEFVRAVLLRRRTGLRKTFSLATIFLERLFDGLVLVGILATLSLVLRLPGWGREVQALSTVLFCGVALGVLLVLTNQRLAERLLGVATRPLPARAATWVTEAFASFMLGLRGIRRPRVLARTLAISALIWMLEGLSYYVLTYAFDFPLAGIERIVACGLLLVVVNLGIMIPSAPGYVGTFQFFAVAALGVFGVEPELALSVSIVSHAMQYLLVTAIGAFFVMREHLSWSSLAAAPEADEAMPEALAPSGVAE